MIKLQFNPLPLGIFAVLATAKGFLEAYAHSKNRTEKKGDVSSQFISVVFMLCGFLTPGSILLEICLLGSTLPWQLCVTCLCITPVVWYFRFLCIKELQEFYSVNVIVQNQHRLIKTGPYKYFRHPIYVLGIVENITYPMACGAWMTATWLSIIDTGATLIRRHHEQQQLILKFGKEYLQYMEETIW
ncbi:hypothetical protein Pelo_8303 [Pelomyxa schiedti]|nr:hypothetical protein Pelo_8303 [Pelomyxa schiedti]